jgi:NitT/TauT family transport system ATP-binding protein
VLLTELGRRFLDADINGRKIIFRAEILTLATFQFVLRLLKEARGNRLHKDIVEEELAMRLTTEDIDKVFQTIVGWGRFGELFNYDASTEELSIDPDPSTLPDKNVSAVQ